MPNKHPQLKLSRDEETFLRHWMYEELHYQDGPGPAKRLQIQQQTWPTDLALLIAAAIPDTTEQWTVGEGPPPAEPPVWPWSAVGLRSRLQEAESVLAARREAR